MREEAKARGNARDRGSRFAPRREAADFPQVLTGSPRQRNCTGVKDVRNNLTVEQSDYDTQAGNQSQSRESNPTRSSQDNEQSRAGTSTTGGTGSSSPGSSKK